MTSENETVRLSCPSCGRSLNVKQRLLGRQVKCPECGKKFATPEAPSAIVGPTALGPVAARRTPQPVADLSVATPIEVLPVQTAVPQPPDITAPVEQAGNAMPMIDTDGIAPTEPLITPIEPVINAGGTHDVTSESATSTAPGELPVTDSTVSTTSRIHRMKKKRGDNSWVIYVVVIAAVIILLGFALSL